MTKGKLYHFRTAVIGFLLLRASIVHAIECSFSSALAQLNPSSASLELPALKDIFSTGAHPFNMSFQETLDNETYGPEKERSQSEKEKGKKRMPGCMCQCRTSDRAKVGRFHVRRCRLQWRFTTPAVGFGPEDCWLGQHPICSRNTESGRRLKKFRLVAWSVDSTLNARGQAQRNKLRSQGMSLNQTAHCPKRSVPGHIHDLLLMLHNQRNEGGRKGKGSVIIHALVSLMTFVLLYLGDRFEQGTSVELIEHLSSLLRRPAFVHRTVRKDEAIKPTTLHPSTVPCHSQTGASYKPSNPSILWKNPSHIEEHILTGLTGGGQFDWCFSTDWMVPLTHLVTVAPASQQFLPTVASSREPDCLDHLGYRLASLSAIPSSCFLSRVRLAEAGFHYDPSADPSAVRCHRCPARYSLEQVPGAPGPQQAHQFSSPQCPLVLAASHRFSGRPPSTASVPVPTSVPSSLTHQIDLSEDGAEATTVAGRRDDGGDQGTRQTSCLKKNNSGTGYMLALASSAMDHRLEYKALCTDGISGTASNPSASSASAAAANPGRYETDSYKSSLGSCLNLGDAVYPQFSTVQSRIVTFNTWPPNVAAAFPANHMAGLGFYYAGYADCVRCFFCGVGLKSWDAQDDPLKEHVRWRPNCGYLLATRGHLNIRRLLNAINGANDHDQPVQAANDGNSLSSGSSSGARQQQGSGSEDSTTSVYSQLKIMGFPDKDILDARDRLKNSGKPEDMNNILQVLLP